MRSTREQQRAERQSHVVSPGAPRPAKSNPSLAALSVQGQSGPARIVSGTEVRTLNVRGIGLLCSMSRQGLWR